MKLFRAILMKKIENLIMDIISDCSNDELSDAKLAQLHLKRQTAFVYLSYYAKGRHSVADMEGIFEMDRFKNQYIPQQHRP